MANPTITDTFPKAAPTALHRDVGRSGLLFASLGGIIGSGWLFGALYSAQSAGPAALISWVIGGLAVLLLALIYAELGSTFPVAGGVARFPHISHGSLVSFTTGWVAWLAYVTVAPIEVEAALQYASNYLPWLTHVVNGTVVLTASGYGVAAALMLVFVLINLVGVKQMADTNTVIGWWKLGIPTLTFIALIVVGFHGSNLTAFGGFAPYGAKGILSAVSTSGVIFSYLGFRQAVELGGESDNPKKNIPFAVIGSVLIGLVLYVFLQLALLGAVSPSGLAKGWSSLTFAGHFGPFAGLATTLGLSWLAILLYSDAIISPGGTGLIYTSSTARLTYALARNRYLPKWFTTVSLRGVPIWSILFTFLIGMIVFLPFPGWQSLVGFISSASVLSYGIGPIALAAIRRQQPEIERPYKLPGFRFWAPVAFIISNLIVYWTGWATNYKLFLAVLLGFIVLAVAYSSQPEDERPQLSLGNGIWLFPYFIGLAILSFLGSFGGGLNVLPFGWDMLVVALYSLLIYYWAIRVRLSDEETKQYVLDLES